MFCINSDMQRAGRLHLLFTANIDYLEEPHAAPQKPFLLYQHCQ